MIGRVALIGALAAGPALARDVAFPSNCTPFLTVQSADCSVLAAARCSGEAGETLRLQVYEESGLVNVEEQTLDWSLLFTASPTKGVGVFVDEGPHDELSRDSIERYGEDYFNYNVVFAIPDMGEFETQLTGFLSSEDEVVEIDGHMLDLYRFRFAATLGDVGTLEVDQSAFGSAEFGFFINGKGVQRFDGEETPLDSTPIVFFEPGEAGFESADPKFNCGATDILAPMPEVRVPEDGV